MATDEVFMDIPQVETMAKNFNSFGDVLDAVAKAMSALSMSLKAAAWLSFGATAAAAAYIDRIEPNVKKASAKMKELSQDIVSAIRSYRDGDNSGSRRFV
jgi:Proteins of 100 residues with WXG